MNIWTLPLPTVLLVGVLAVAIGLLLIWLGDKAIDKLWPEDKEAPYVPPGPGLDMDAIYSNPNLRFADPAPKAGAHFKTKINTTTTRDAGNDVNAGL